MFYKKEISVIKEDASSDSKFKISHGTASLIGGTLGGLAGVVAGHPFDTIKVRLQSQNPAAQIYRGTIHCAVTIIKQERVTGLFKGMLSPMIGVAAVNSLLFGVYGTLLDIQKTDKAPTLLQIFIAGSGSGLVNAVISTPMELVKIQMQNQGTKSLSLPGNVSTEIFKGPGDCIRKIYTNLGIRGLFRGFPITILRETPSYGAYFVSYELFCNMLRGPDGSLDAWKLMLAGGMGGVVGWTTTYPFDVAKTIIQSDRNLLNPKHKPIRAIDCLRLIIRQSGSSALFRGLNATIIRAFPTNVAILTTWQLAINYFKDAGMLDVDSIPSIP